MVGLSVVTENFLNIMPRSKTNANLKASSQRRSSVQPRSPYFWQDTPRKSISTAKPGNSGRLSYRRKSTGETYRIWDLGENGIKNIRLIEMAENESDNDRQANHIFPPISSLRNPRLLSATPSARSEKRTKRTSTTIGRSRHSSNQSKSNKSISNASHKLLHSGRSNTEDFCHGLPRGGKQEEPISFIDTTETPSRIANISSFRNKVGESKASPPNHGMKPRSSSLRSQPSSSDGSIRSAAFRNRMASRRFSLPVTPSTPQSLLPRKLKELSKATELSSRSHLSSGDKKSQKTRSLLTSSDKFSSPPSSTAARDTVPVTTHVDGLHIIEETPAEPGTPIRAAVWDKVSTVKEGNDDKNNSVVAGDREADTASNQTSKLSNALSVNVASEDYKLALTSLTISELNHTGKIDETPEISVTKSPVIPLKNIVPNEESDQPDINNNGGANVDQMLDPISLITQKAELLTSSSRFGDNESIIDATILNELDDDLCDADFREKRIIQWILSAETGLRVEQQVASAVSPSPTNGSRETAITVIYGE